MSDPSEMPIARPQPAPEIVEIAKAIARGLAREDYERATESAKIGKKKLKSEPPK